jgi:hypothetical protein
MAMMRGRDGWMRLKLRDLPCDPNFRDLEWWGFVSMATTASVYYVDDIFLSGK